MCVSHNFCIAESRLYWVHRPTAGEVAGGAQGAAGSAQPHPPNNRSSLLSIVEIQREKSSYYPQTKEEDISSNWLRGGTGKRKRRNCDGSQFEVENGGGGSMICFFGRHKVYVQYQQGAEATDDDTNLPSPDKFLLNLRMHISYRHQNKFFIK